jgi:hypothetical protein
MKTESIQFTGGMTANARIADHLGWRAGIDRWQRAGRVSSSA